MKTLCKLFGHQWTYYFSPTDALNQGTYLRSCKHCKTVQRLKDISFPGQLITKEWITCVQYTKEGAKKSKK